MALFWTPYRSTTSVSTKPIDTRLSSRTGYVSAAENALSIAAKAILTTVDPGARIWLAASRQTSLTIRTTNKGAGIRTAFTGMANSFVFTNNVYTEVLAPSFCAGFVFTSTTLLLTPRYTGSVSTKHVFLAALTVRLNVACC